MRRYNKKGFLTGAEMKADIDRLEIVRLNIAHYERLLATETDSAKLRTLRTLLVEARNEQMLIKDEGALEQTTKAAPELRQDAKRWRMKAEEYRTVADATASEAARNTYLYLARSYEVLAARAEGRAGEEKTQSQSG